MQLAPWAWRAGQLGLAAVFLTPAGCNTAPAANNTQSKTLTLRMPRVAGYTQLASDLFKRSEFTPIFSAPLPEPGGAPVSVPDRWQTRAKLAWDPQHLFVLFESIGPRPQSSFTKHDELLHQADAVEVFLDVTGGRRDIVEIQTSPAGITADYYHTWSAAPDYPANQLNDDFYRKHHTADRSWNLDGLEVKSMVEDLSPGQTRWTVMLAVPMAESLARAGLPPTLRVDQPIYINLLRYAYSVPGGDLTQYNLVPVRSGRPHQSPMGVVRAVAAP